MIGIDIVDIKKFEEKANNAYFIENAFTPNEIAYAKRKNNPNQTLAGILAAKEAAIKCHDLSIFNILRGKIEVCHENGKPYIMYEEKNLEDRISISHDGDYAIAVCSTKNDNLIQVDDKIKSIYPKRSRVSHKGDYGRIAILGGSPGMAGSVYMSSLAAMRAGAGLTYIITPNSISNILEIKSNEQIIRPISCESFSYDSKILDEVLSELSDKDVLAIGPGMAKGNGLNQFIKAIFESINIPIIIDADGLNAVSKDLGVLDYGNTIVLTPHLAEFARLSGLNIDDINNDRENIAKDFARTHGVILVLKSENTIVTDGNQIYINKIGNPGMATAGSGDVLTGILAALIKRLDPYNACVLGVYIHSLAADLAKIEIGEDSIIATDIISYISNAMNLLNEND